MSWQWTPDRLDRASQAVVTIVSRVLPRQFILDWGWLDEMPPEVADRLRAVTGADWDRSRDRLVMKAENAGSDVLPGSAELHQMRRAD